MSTVIQTNMQWYWYEFYRQGLHRDFFFSFGFFVEVICCMFDQFLFCHIDGKNLSATTRLDCICICLFYLYIKCRSRGKFFRFYLSLSFFFHSLFFLFFFHNFAEIEIIFYHFRC